MAQNCKAKRRVCILGTIYRPPSSSVSESVSEITSDLQIITSSVDIAKVDLILLGDFNINYAKTRSCDVRKLKEMEKIYHL